MNFGDGAVGARGLKKLDLRVSDLEEGCSDLLVFHYFLLVAFQPENFLVVFDCFGQIGDGYADVLDM